MISIPNFWRLRPFIEFLDIRIPTRMRLGNGMVVKTLLGDMIGCHIWHSGWYEPHIIEVLRPLLSFDTCFLDIGAHIGQYTLFAAPLVQEVHSFEASPSTFKFLSWNVGNNNLKNVQINQVAVSDHDGKAVLSESNRTNTAQWHLQAGDSKSGARSTVSCISLDSYLSTMTPVAQRYVAKIDVEGAEMLVLSKAERFFSLRPVILIEIIDTFQRRFGGSAEQLKKLITNHCYRLTALDATNFLAVPVALASV